MAANPILSDILDMSLEILIPPHDLFYASESKALDFFSEYSFMTKQYTTSSKNLVVTITTINVYCILEETRIVHCFLGHSKNILMHLISLTPLVYFMTLISIPCSSMWMHFMML